MSAAAPAISSATAKATWFARPGASKAWSEIGNVVIATRGGVPVRVRDVAEVKIGRELRTGSASENGQEVVIGTALMLIGGNSRTVSAAVDSRDDGDQQVAAARH